MFSKLANRFATTCVLIEHDGVKLSKSALSSITAASQLSQDILAVVLGTGSESVAEEVSKIDSITRVMYSEDKQYAANLAENVAPLLRDIIKENDVSHVIGTSCANSKNILPRTSALLDVQPMTDVVKIISADTFQRPIYAGNAIATIKSNDKVKIFTIRPTAFDACAVPGSNSAKIEAVLQSDSTHDAKLSALVKMEVIKSDRPDLQTASAVIAGGRGLKNEENFGILYTLADKLNAAVGASRAAVDAGYAPNDMQIGQTGKVVAPDLYIAVGISGAIQHLSGMKDSKTIVAINKDPEAPIFQVADYGLVEDLFKAVPELTASI